MEYKLLLEVVVVVVAFVVFVGCFYSYKCTSFIVFGQVVCSNIL